MGRYYRNKKTDVSLAWDSTLGAYNLKFSNTYNWDQMQGVVIWIKQTIPWNERDYDPNTKIWGIHEKHVQTLKKLLELIDEFNFIFVEKPEASTTDGQTYQSAFVPLDVYKQKFKDLTGENLNDNDYSASKRIYRRACMLLHPDRNPDNPSVASKMSDLNEAWTQLEIKLFKVRSVATQEVWN